jgi:hypothetical protein
MNSSMSHAKSHVESVQLCQTLQKLDSRTWKQEWNKGKEEFRLKINGYTEYIVARDFSAKSNSMYSIKVSSLNRERSVPVEFGDPLHRQLHRTFHEIDALRHEQRKVVSDAIRDGTILNHIRERDLYPVNHSPKGVLFSSELPDHGFGAILVRGDLTRDQSNPNKTLILQVTWRSSTGTGGPLTSVVDPRYSALLEPRR